jgi:hypothetical protein
MNLSAARRGSTHSPTEASACRLVTRRRRRFTCRIRRGRRAWGYIAFAREIRSCSTGSFQTSTSWSRVNRKDPIHSFHLSVYSIPSPFLIGSKNQTCRLSRDFNYSTPSPFPLLPLLPSPDHLVSATPTAQTQAHKNRQRQPLVHLSRPCRLTRRNQTATLPSLGG